MTGEPPASAGGGLAAPATSYHAPMPLRVYCPECHAPRTVPRVGARVRCRNCDRIFRAGTRIEPGAHRAERDRAESSPGAQKLLIVLGGIAILVFGLTIGGGLAAWYVMTHPAHDPDEERFERDEELDQPPPVVADPGPVAPRPNGHEP